MQGSFAGSVKSISDSEVSLCKSSFWNIWSLVPSPVSILAFIVSEPLLKLLYDNLAELSVGFLLKILSISSISLSAILLYTFVKVLSEDAVSK